MGPLRLVSSESELLLDLFDLEGLDDVAGLLLVEAVEADTALHALGDFLHVFLEVLERVDSSGFAEHRRSTFEQAHGNPDDALHFARIADQKIANPPFEVLANLANWYPSGEGRGLRFR